MARTDEDKYVDISGWPMCAVDGCPNHCCLALESKYCWPHTIIGRNLGELEAEKQEVKL